MNKAIVFTGGVVVGGIAGYFIAKFQFKKEIDILEQEVKDVQSAYDGYFKSKKETETDKISLNDAEQRAYKDHLERYAPTEEDPEDIYEEGPIEVADEPYVISYEQFANEHIADFDKRTLTYYEQDDVLVNDEMEILNVDFYIGRESLEHVGEEETDTVHVRNEKNCVDYEVQVTHVKFREELSNGI